MSATAVEAPIGAWNDSESVVRADPRICGTATVGKAVELTPPGIESFDRDKDCRVGEIDPKLTRCQYDCTKKCALATYLVAKSTQTQNPLGNQPLEQVT